MIPFIAGAVIGALGVVVVHKKGTIKEKVLSTTTNAKDNITKATKNVKSKIHKMTAEDNKKTVEEKAKDDN